MKALKTALGIKRMIQTVKIMDGLRLELLVAP